MAISFLRSCVPEGWLHIIDQCDTLQQTFQTLSLYTANEELYIRKILDAVRGRDRATSYKEDKILLTFFEASLIKVTKLNSAYCLDFSSAHQMISKLSNVALRREYKKELDTVRNASDDTHTTRNYMITMKQMIHNIRIAIDSDIDIEEINIASKATVEGVEATAYTVATTTPNTQPQSFPNSNRGGNSNYQNRGRGRGNFGKPNN